jgi:signal transduction histidine kinase
MWRHNEQIISRNPACEGRKALPQCENVVEKLNDQIAARADTFQLAWLAMRTLSSAIALLRGESLLIANSRWYELADPLNAQASWRAVPHGDGPETCYESLDLLACGEAARLTGGQKAVIGSFERVGSGQVIEVQVEQLEQPGAGPIVVAVAHDVTERKQAERDLERARQALAHQGRMRAAGELASGVAHDLNNVLGSLVLRIALLQSDAACIEAQGDNIGAIARILKDASARVRRLQDLARRPSDVLLEALDVGAIIRDAIEMVRAEVEDKASFAGTPIRIVARFSELPLVSGSSAADLRHMFINLMLNARDAMPNGGMIEIDGKSRGGNVIVNIADDGTGIPEDFITKIFDPFFTTKGERGTGLGLSNCYEMMAALGGKIKASNRPSGGAIFTLTFPIAVERLVPQRGSSPKASPGQRILVIDDDPEHLIMTKAVIELEEQEVDVAASGKEALDRLRGGARYDLVLCDAGMPELNGWQVAQEIRVLTPDTKVYLLTGWAQQIAEDDPRRSLVSGVLAKPMNLDRIRSILSR